MKKVWIEIDVKDVEISGTYDQYGVRLRFQCEQIDIINEIGKDAVMEYWGLIEKQDDALGPHPHDMEQQS